MAFTERLSLVIDANGKGAISELKKVGDTANREIGRAESSTQRLSSQLTSVGAVSLTAGAVMATGLYKAVQASSDLVESQGQVSVIFGASADSVEKFGDTAAKTMGQSKKQALDAASTFATFGKGAGLSGEGLVSFSTKLVALSSDLASFKNTSPEDAITAVGAALRGESEPIRRYGVLLDDATLRQEALRQGLIKTTKDALTPQQRVLAAYQVILKQTGDAQGDFARTSDGLANSQRTMSAEMQDALAKFGDAARPIFTDITKGATKVIDSFNGLSPEVQGLVGKIAAIGTVGTLAVGGLSLIAGQLVKVKSAATAAASALSKVSGISISAASLAAGAAYVAVLDQIVEKGREAQKTRVFGDVNVQQPQTVVEGFGKAIDDLGGKSDSLAERFARGFLGPFGDAANIALKGKNALEEYNAKLKDTQDYLKGLSANDANAYLDQLSEASKAAGVSLQLPNGRNLVDVLRESTPSLNGSADAISGAGAAAEKSGWFFDKFAASARGVGAAASESADSVTKWTDELKKSLDPIQSAVSAQQSLADAHDATVDAEKKLSDMQATSGKRSDDYKAAVRSLADAQDRLRDSVDAAAEAHDKLRKAQAALTGETDPGRRAAAQQTAANAQSEFDAAQASLRGLDPNLDADRYRKAAQRLADAQEARNKAQRSLTAVDPKNDPNRYAEALSDLRDAQKASARADGQVADSRQSVTDAQKQVNEEAKRGTVGSKEYTEALKNLESARKRETDAAIANAFAQAKFREELEKNPKIAADAVTGMQKLVDQGLLGQDAFDNWKQQVAGLNVELNTLAKNPGLSVALTPAPNLGTGGTVGGLNRGDQKNTDYGKITAPVGTWGLPLKPKKNDAYRADDGSNWLFDGKVWVQQTPPAAGRRALGGPTKAGSAYQVGERGPELYRQGGDMYMLPGASGSVAPQLTAVGGDLTTSIAAAVAAAMSAHSQRGDVTVNNHGVTNAEQTTAATLRGLRKAEFLAGIGPR